MSPHTATETELQPWKRHLFKSHLHLFQETKCVPESIHKTSILEATVANEGDMTNQVRV